MDTTEHLIEQLKSPDWAVHEKAAKELGRRGDAAAAEPLIDYIKNQPLSIQWRELRSIEKMNAPAAVKPLFDFIKEAGNPFINWKVMAILTKISADGAGEPVFDRLKDDDYDIRRRAAKILDKISWEPYTVTESAWYLVGKQKWKKIPPLGKDAVPPLLTLLEDKDGFIRDRATSTLGELQDPRAVGPILRRLNNEPSPNQAVVENALTSIMNAGVTEPFAAALKHPDAGQRLKTAKMLDEIRWRPANMEETALHLTAGQKWTELPALGAAAVGPLVNLLDSRDFDIRRNAIQALGCVGDHRAVKRLTPALKDNDAHIRAAAIEALGETGSPAAIQPIKTALSDKDKRNRRRAVTALGNMSPATVEFLIDLMEDEGTEPELRIAAAEALGNTNDRRAVTPLLRALTDNQYGLPPAAAEALGKIGDPRAVEPLWNTIKNEAPGWEKATSALGEMGDARAIKPLMKIEWQSRETAKILERFTIKIRRKDHHYLCHRCCCRTEKHKPESVLNSMLREISLDYYACRKCHSDLYLTEGVKKVALTLDTTMKEASRRKDGTLTVNWFKRDQLVKDDTGDLFDYDEIRIENADDYEIEKCVLALRNDMDDHRRKRLRKIPVHLAPHLELSPAKLNLLKDIFPNCE